MNKDEKGVKDENVQWGGGNSVRRDVDYFTKTNIWQNVYSINANGKTFFFLGYRWS